MRVIVASSLMSLLLVMPSWGKTIFVSKTGNGNSGTSWSSAYTSLLRAATEAMDGDQVIVAAGTYNEPVVITQSATFLGGFRGIESATSVIGERDVSRFETIIDIAEQEEPCVECTAGAVIGGFILQNARRPGIALHDTSVVAVVEDCTIRLNGGPIFAGGIGITSATATFLRCVIEDNNGSGAGGGLYIVDDSNVFMQDCIIQGNEAGRGAGILCARGSELRMVNCVVRNNHVIYGDPQFVWPNGGVRISGATCVAENCLFSRNFGDQGSQVGLDSGSTGVFKNCTFYEDFPATPPSNGKIWWRRKAPLLENCIVWGGNNAIVRGDLNDPDEPIVRYSCIQGGFPGEGNISDDPLIRDFGGGDFRLQYESPCIDAGALSGPADDLEGNPRPIDIPGVGRDGDNAFDMGAFEFQLPILSPDPRTDINQDGFRDATDLLLLLQDWHRVSGPSGIASDSDAITPRGVQ